MVAMKKEQAVVVTCPTGTLTPEGVQHTVVGCGSANVSGPDSEGLYDCLACGIWFDPAREPK